MTCRALVRQAQQPFNLVDAIWATLPWYRKLVWMWFAPKGLSPLDKPVQPDADLEPRW